MPDKRVTLIMGCRGDRCFSSEKLGGAGIQVIAADFRGAHERSPIVPLETLATLRGHFQMIFRTGAYLILCLLSVSAAAAASGNNDALARDMFAQLVEIDTTDSVGSVTKASEAMAHRLLDAGFPANDIQVLGPSERKRNLVARLRGNGTKRPVLFIGHLDVVEAPQVDWATDPFRFVEKDGYYYGRGTQDMKSADAIAVATLIRLWKERFTPDRDIIVALTSGEESFRDNGVKWLIEQHRDLIDAEFTINLDGAGVTSERGRAVTVNVDAAEKLYADFRLTVINPGGHTSLPASDNAIYRLARGLTRLEQHRFPFELNPLTRGYFSQLAESAPAAQAADFRDVLKSSPSPEAIARVSRDPLQSAMLHTVCAATRLEAGHGNNALPEMASAMVNCRILPGHSAEETRVTLIEALNDPKITVSYVREFDGREFAQAPDSVAMPASPPRPEVIAPLVEIAAMMWPGVPVISGMSIGESDAVWANSAGIPTYRVNGLAIDRDDNRAHGKDERLPVESFFRALEFQYRYSKAVATWQ